MYKIIIFRCTGRDGSLVLAAQLAVLYETEIPNDLDEIVNDLEGDFYHIYYPELEEFDCEF